MTEAESVAAALAWRDFAVNTAGTRADVPGLPFLFGYVDLRQRNDGSWPLRSEVEPSRYKHVLWITASPLHPFPPTGDPFLLPWDLIARRTSDDRTPGTRKLKAQPGERFKGPV